MRITRRSQRRSGLTLLEVLVAMAIFLFSLIAIVQLSRLASHNADDVRWQSRATRLAQSKLAEFVAGVEPFSTTSGGFDEEPDWQWTMTVSSDGTTAQNLYNVTVTVTRDLPNKKHIEASLSQYILDPLVRGNVSAGTTTSSSSSSTTGSGTGSSP